MASEAVQAAQLLPPYPGHEYDTSFLKHEFFFEKLVRMDGADDDPEGH